MIALYSTILENELKNTTTRHVDSKGAIILNISSRDEILTHVTELKFQLPCQFN